MKGNLFIISAPSGAGKSSLIAELLRQDMKKQMNVSISHTSRAPRIGENHGEHYYFTDKSIFEVLIKENNFLEYAEVFGNYYGTSKSMVVETLNAGQDVLLDIDWQGARQVKENFINAIGIFILPPSLTELEHRLYKRQQDSEENIKYRMKQAKAEISHYNEYDYVVINDDMHQALEEIRAIITASRTTMKYQNENNSLLLKQLLSN